MKNTLTIYQTIVHLINRDGTCVYDHVLCVETLSDGSHLVVLPNGGRAVLPAGTLFEYQV